MTSFSNAAIALFPIVVEISSKRSGERHRWSQIQLFCLQMQQLLNIDSYWRLSFGSV